MVYTKSVRTAHENSFRSATAIPVSPATRRAWEQARNKAYLTRPAGQPGWLVDHVEMAHDSKRTICEGDSETTTEIFWVPSASDPDAEYAVSLVTHRVANVSTVSIACSCDAAIHGQACVHGGALIVDQWLNFHLYEAR